jgi:hypothetical protein
MAIHVHVAGHPLKISKMPSAEKSLTLLGSGIIKSYFLFASKVPFYLFLCLFFDSSKFRGKKY